MIEDFAAFLEYYSDAPPEYKSIFTHPLVRIEYDEVAANGEATIALLAPFSHAINALCYREIDVASFYNQKRISQICCVSPAEVSSWKNEERIPNKYRWFLLLIDISSRVQDAYIKKIIQPPERMQAEIICDVFLRMVKTCYEPFCVDDFIMMNAVWKGTGIEKAKEELLSANPKYWKQIFGKCKVT